MLGISSLVATLSMLGISDFLAYSLIFGISDFKAKLLVSTGLGMSDKLAFKASLAST